MIRAPRRRDKILDYTDPRERDLKKNAKLQQEFRSSLVFKPEQQEYIFLRKILQRVFYTDTARVL